MRGEKQLVARLQIERFTGVFGKHDAILSGKSHLGRQLIV
jgi:hypothetical protein